ncbi:hypothetical protein H3H36_15660 [Duganella sp. FT3S]|uniref:Uncharacterized protein n=1 Tax=Rugamonas fusca TaxID=2758568 RepID=A0A7W2EJ18_9BURK|nr:hypothetical protein [Rugamonas fusca]MBA5606793.1 hypothetical protein [Rugamonas fusca]
MNFKSQERIDNIIPIIRKSWIPIAVVAGLILYSVITSENTVEEESQQQVGIAEDQVYVYTNNLIAQLNTYPQCVMLAKAMREMASSQAPDQIRIRQVDKIFSKMPEMCIQH